MYTFGFTRGVGAETMSEYFVRLHLEEQVGCSPNALRGVMQRLEPLIVETAKTWESEASVDGEVRDIIGAVDETFLEYMMLVLMDLHSGYILLEEVAEDRTYKTWKALVDQRLETLKCGVRYLVSDRASLSRSHEGQLHTLLGFADLKQLVPLQPHGVLATTEAYEAENAEALARLARGMIKASRALHDDYATFRQVYDAHVTVPLPDADVESIWRREHDTGGFAVNGEMSAEHWDAQLDSYFALNPDMTHTERDDLLIRQ